MKCFLESGIKRGLKGFNYSCSCSQCHKSRHKDKVCLEI